MIRIRHLMLPPGLSALVRRTPAGDLEILVSDALDPLGQRAAVRVALRSSRQAGWRAGVLPIPLLLLLGASRSGLRAASRVLRVHAVASAAAASVAVASAVTLIVALPHHHAPLSASEPPSAGRVQAPGRTTNNSPPNSGSPHPAPTAAALRLPRQTASPAAIPSALTPTPGQNSATAAPSSTPAPAPSSSTPSSPAATASPAPSQPPSGGQTCLVLLGLWVCL